MSSNELKSAQMSVNKPVCAQKRPDKPKAARVNLNELK